MAGQTAYLVRISEGGAVCKTEVPLWAQWTTAKVVILYWFSGRLLWVGPRSRSSNACLRENRRSTSLAESSSSSLGSARRNIPYWPKASRSSS